MICIQKTALSLLALSLFYSSMHSMSSTIIRVAGAATAVSVVGIGYVVKKAMYKQQSATQITQALQSHNFSVAANILKKFDNSLKSYSNRDAYFATLLSEQVNSDNIVGVKWLVENGWIKNINATDLHKVSPFYYTCFNQSLDIAKYLVSKGAIVSQTASGDYPSLLHKTVFLRKPEFVKYYLQQGFPVDAVATRGRIEKTALELADMEIPSQSPDVNETEQEQKIRQDTQSQKNHEVKKVLLNNGAIRTGDAPLNFDEINGTNDQLMDEQNVHESNEQGTAESPSIGEPIANFNLNYYLNIDDLPISSRL